MPVKAAYKVALLLFGLQPKLECGDKFYWKPSVSNLIQIRWKTVYRSFYKRMGGKILNRHSTGKYGADFFFFEVQMSQNSGNNTVWNNSGRALCILTNYKKRSFFRGSVCLSAWQQVCAQNSSTGSIKFSRRYPHKAQ